MKEQDQLNNDHLIYPTPAPSHLIISTPPILTPSPSMSIYVYVYAMSRCLNPSSPPLPSSAPRICQKPHVQIARIT